MAAAPREIRFRQGAGRLCLDLVRTLRHRGRPNETEELPDAAAVQAWIRQCGPTGLVAGVRPPTGTEVAELRQLREAVHTLLTADPQRPGHPPAAALATVNRAAARPVPTPTLGERRAVRWNADRPCPATAALVARDAIDLIASGDVDRVRACANPTCGALFWDGSRPGTRRWCSMGTCGNRAKKAALHARNAAG